MAVRQVFGAVLLAYAVATGGAAAQEAEVRGAITETLSSWSSGDFETFGGYYSADARGFFLDGGNLVQGINVQALKAGYDAGLRAEFELRDLDVSVVDGVAVSSGYLDGSLTLPGGVVQSGTWRYTETRVREAGTWKVIQFHFSELATAGR